MSSGEKNTKGGSNIFIGTLAGYRNTIGTKNIFIGLSAGNKNTTGKENTFVGYAAGFKNTEGSHNTFVGRTAGYKNTKGDSNIFVGPGAGYNNTTGGNNIFVGRGAGYHNTEGFHNIFIGSRTGGLGRKQTGKYNTFVGSESGRQNTTGQSNTFVGSGAGIRNTTGKNNTFVGSGAGIRNTTGENNIFIGYAAGDDKAYKSKSNKFIVGSYKNKTWLEGDIGSNTLRIKETGKTAKRICIEGGTGGGTCGIPGSSRYIKKKIKPHKNFRKSLQDILKTPLFTFQFKEDKLEKDHIGVISEELPDHLQIKGKGEHSRPDWKSIYGTFWGAIKALHKIFMEFKEEHQEQHKSLSQENNKLYIELKSEFQESLKSLSQENKELRKEIDDINKRLDAVKKEKKIADSQSESG